MNQDQNDNLDLGAHNSIQDTDASTGSQEPVIDEENLEIEPSVEYMPFDFASALEELNHERESMFSSPDNNAVPPEPALSQAMIQKHIAKYGIADFLGLVRDAINHAGYIKQDKITLIHNKSGVLIKF